MAAPYIVLSTTTYPASLNLTAVTSKTGAFDPLAGTDGSDWCAGGFASSDNLSVLNSRIRANGQLQLVPKAFWTPGDAAVHVGNNVLGITPSWDPLDEIQNTSSGHDSNACPTFDFGAAQINCGISYDVIFAPYSALKTLHWFGRVQNGTWVAEATFSDAKYPTQTLVLPDSSNFGLVCTFHGAAPGTTLQLRIKHTGAGGDVATVFPHMAYIEQAKPIRKPTGGKDPLLPLIGI
jgi:hypothetical protein